MLLLTEAGLENRMIDIQVGLPTMLVMLALIGIGLAILNHFDKKDGGNK